MMLMNSVGCSARRICAVVATVVVGLAVFGLCEQAAAQTPNS
jgi:hypothetical protein